jgi:hypothetical protein
MLTSCALKPIISEYNFTKKDIENVDINKLGNGNILIYNGANILHTLDNTARLNIWIDNKALGQIKPKEYVIINLKENKYQFKLLHIDVVKFRSLHDIEIDEKTKVIKIKPTIGSNKLEITNELPKRIAKFKHANN